MNLYFVFDLLFVSLIEFVFMHSAESSVMRKLKNCVIRIFPFQKLTVFKLHNNLQYLSFIPVFVHGRTEKIYLSQGEHTRWLVNAGGV